MEKLQFDCEHYKLYSPDSLKYITDNMHELLLKKIKCYINLFDIDNFLKIQINYFDDLDKFRNFIYELRGEKETLPDYAKGTYDNGMINAFIPNDLVIGSYLYNNKLYMANHELFHILYLKYILQGDYSKRIVWYDEGMAQFMSGENDNLLDIKKFKEFYINVKNSTKVMPNINEIIHGNSFYNEYYNGYNLSYLSIRYLNDVLDEKEFKELMSNFKLIKKYGETIVEDMFNYYDNKFND